MCIPDHCGTNTHQLQSTCYSLADLIFYSILFSTLRTSQGLWPGLTPNASTACSPSQSFLPCLPSTTGDLQICCDSQGNRMKNSLPGPLWWAAWRAEKNLKDTWELTEQEVRDKLKAIQLSPSFLNVNFDQVSPAICQDFTLNASFSCLYLSHTKCLRGSLGKGPRAAHTSPHQRGWLPLKRNGRRQLNNSDSWAHLDSLPQSTH